MGFEMQENQTKYYKIADLTKGMALTAIYTGSTQSGEYNTFTHYFKEEDGSSVGLNGCADLNKRLSLVEPNTKVKVVYNGIKKISTKHGIINAHSFWIEAADDEGILAPVILGSSNDDDDDESLRA